MFEWLQNPSHTYVYAIEIVVILAVILFLCYVWFALGVFKKQ